MWRSRVLVFLVFMVAVGLSELSASTPVPAPVSAPGPLGPWMDRSGGATVHTRMVRKHHLNASAGGDVILGGFAFAVVASILCYIRVTRRDRENTSFKPEDFV